MGRLQLNWVSIYRKKLGKSLKTKQKIYYFYKVWKIMDCWKSNALRKR